MKQIHVKLSESLHRELKIQATIKGQTIQDYVVEAIKNQLALEKADDVPLIMSKGANDDDTAK